MPQYVTTSRIAQVWCRTRRKRERCRTTRNQRGLTCPNGARHDDSLCFAWAIAHGDDIPHPLANDAVVLDDHRAIRLIPAFNAEPPHLKGVIHERLGAWVRRLVGRWALLAHEEPGVREEPIRSTIIRETLFWIHHQRDHVLDRCAPLGAARAICVRMAHETTFSGSSFELTRSRFSRRKSFCFDPRINRLRAASVDAGNAASTTSGRQSTRPA